MDEFSFIDAIKQQTYKQSSTVKGIGDDAAVFRLPSNDIVTSVDTFVDEIHFSKKTMDPFYVGYRALAANISDIAAMGASPAYYLVSIVVPKTWDIIDIKEIFDGMKALAGEYKMDLFGGDTVSGNELAISVTIIGYTEKNKARYRSAAKAGDVVFATGTLGDSRAGLHILLHPDQYKEDDFLIRRHRMPSPRADFARHLDGFSRLALNDISDGLANEANEIAEASNVTMTIKDTQVPLSKEYIHFSSQQKNDWQYYGGEDFELLGTVSKEAWPEVQRIAEKTGTMVTEIGYISDCGAPGVFLEKNNKRKRLQKMGYTHLK